MFALGFLACLGLEALVLAYAWWGIERQIASYEPIRRSR